MNYQKTETMTTQIPKLRFPEFADKWDEKKLGEITTWTSGGTPSKENAEYWDGDIPWISASSMRGIKYYDSNIKITEKGLKKGSRLTKKGTLLILVRGSMLFNTIPIGLAMRDLAFNQDVKAIEVSEESTSKFILYWFISNEGKVLNMVTGTGIGAGKLDLTDLKQLPISLPQLPEQTKIANFLTAIDDKIQALKQKKTLLEQYKKGIMQQIFSQELRFKNDDGSDFDDWEEKSLGEIGETYNGLTGKTKEDFGEGKPYIQYKQIFDNSKIDINRFDYVDIKEDENQKKVRFGDVFFTVSSETQNEIGYSSVLLDVIKEDLYLNSFCFGYRPFSLKTLNPFFARFLFRSESFRNDIIKLAQGSTRYNMSKVQLMKLQVSLPTETEQQKIANFLTAIDEKIEKVSQQITATETYKKGLLQQMFC